VEALERLGKKKWAKNVYDVVARLRNALQADYVVLGGGNAKRLGELPPRTFLGDNQNAREGGFRLWLDLDRQRETDPGCHLQSGEGRGVEGGPGRPV
jgi:hypothetical protein